MAAVSYLKIEDINANCHVSLLFCKSKLPPMKNFTMLRLELCAAVLAVHNDSLLRRELEIELQESYFYTDSMIDLYYIHIEAKALKTFVANR